MNRILILFLISFISINSFSQEKTLKAYLDSKQFYAPGVGNYVEFNLQFVGYSLNYVSKENGLIGEVAIAMQIHDGDSLIASDAYRLETPFMRDSIIEDFYDVQRFQLKPGSYDFHIVLQDLNGNSKAMDAHQNIIIDDLSDAISISDINVAEVATVGDPSSNFFKSGYNIIPRISTFYPEQLTAIPVYFEVYNSALLEDTIFGLKQTVINAENGKELAELTKFTVHKVSDVVPVLRSVSIEKVPTGKYTLSFTLINRNMTELSAQSYDFERSNDSPFDFFTDEIILDPSFQASITDDSVGYYLEALIPISRSNEVKNIIDIAKSKNAENARKHIQSYWSVTNPENPYEGWIRYKQQVQLVEKLYANNFQEGYETDRGRVYLQYGSPTNINGKENSPTEYPYEIWQYNKIGTFSNKRFVFYNPDLVNNAYRLIHSDMLGELKNPGWPRELSKRNTTNGNVDDPNNGVIDHWGGNSNDIFRQY